MSDTNCPYCGADIEICHDDGFGHEEGVLHEYKCPECDKGFVFETSIVFYYEAHKADCLNDGEHKYEETHTWPRKYTRLRCADCGDEQPLPEGHPFLKKQ